MPDRQERKTEEKKTGSDKGQLQPPAINLPNGGGAIKGIDEKFTVNPATAQVH